MQTNVTKLLDENSIGYLVKPHSKKVYTCEEAAIERGVRVEQIVKCMVVKVAANEFIMALIPGNKRLSLKQLARACGVKRVSIASREEVQAVTGYPVGAISPIGIRKRNIDIYMDDSVKNEEFVDISSGRPDAGIELTSSNLIDLLNPHISTIVE